jgi:hypothetical protein
MEFQKRVESYMAVQKAALATVPPLPPEGVADVDLIEEHERQLAEAVRSLRPGAARGDLFTPEITSMIVATIRRQTSGADGASAREMIFDEGNPESEESPAIVHLAVNRAYPSDAPLSSMPPSLLFALPELPRGLEYRFVGRNLILRDSEANLILDIIFNAVDRYVPQHSDRTGV